MKKKTLSERIGFIMNSYGKLVMMAERV